MMNSSPTESSENSAAGRISIPTGINGHDVHCKAHYPHLTDANRCLWCTVIRKVREENEENLDVEYWVGYNNGYTQGYMDGYSDAEKEYTNPCLFCGHDDFSTYVCDDCKEEYMNEDIEGKSTNGDNDATSND